MKIYTLAAGENWVCDRFTEEWIIGNRDISTYDAEEADILWLLASWCWNQVPINLLEHKTVVCTVHHLVPGKLDKNTIHNFLIRDK